jgi:hypothetical protein
VNQNENIFLYDNQTGTIMLVNHAPGLPNTTGNGGLGNLGSNRRPPGSRPPSYLQPVISADGNFVAFASFDLNLVPNENVSSTLASRPFQPHVYLYNVQTGQITLVSHAPGAPTTIAFPAANPVINADGSYVAYIYGFPGDDNFETGQQGTAVLYNRATDTQTFITVLPPGNDGGPDSDPVIDDSGRYVAFVLAPRVFLFDRNSGTSVPIGQAATLPATHQYYPPVLSHDGRSVAFVGYGGQNASSITNVFLYTVSTGQVSLVSGANGSATVAGNGNSDSPAIDGHGSYIAYRSDATNLVNGPSGGGSNIFEFNTQTHTQTLISHQAGSPLTAAVGNSSEPVIDDDGHLVSYVSAASNLIPGQSGTAGVKNVYIWLRQTETNILASGQNGSPTLTGNADSDSPLLTRNSFPGFSSTATNLVTGVGGSSVAYINKLVELVLSPATVADSSRPGTVVGSLSIASLLLGQYLPPTYSLPVGVDDNGPAGLPAFVLSGANLVINFQPQYPVKQTYEVRVLVQNTGFGDQSLDVSVSIAPPAATHFSVSVPPSASAGTAMSVIVSALDAYNHVVPGYTGTVHFSSPDATATFPPNYTFTAADNGVHTFTCILTLAPTDPISVNDVTTSAVAGSATVNVQPAGPSRLSFGQQPSNTAAGFPIPLVTVQILGRLWQCRRHGQ